MNLIRLVDIQCLSSIILENTITTVKKTGCSFGRTTANLTVMKQCFPAFDRNIFAQIKETPQYLAGGAAGFKKRDKNRNSE